MALVTEQQASRRPRPALLATLLALVAAVLGALLIAPDRASAEGVSGEVTVYRNAVTEGDGTRTPDIISTSANNAVVAWREGTTAAVISKPGARVVDRGYIRYSYTTDGGAHWSRPQTLAQETSEYAWHYVVLYRTGNEIFAYLGRTTATESNNGLPINAVVAKRSIDEGHTWQDFTVNMPLDLDTTDNTGSGLGNLALAGRPVQLADGTHVMPYWASGRKNGALYSTDLVNWTAGTPAANATGYLAGESQLVVSQDDPNKLVMVARNTLNGGTQKYALTATSTNGGRSWTSFALDTNVPGYDSKVYFTKDSTGRYLTIYNTADDKLALNYKVKAPGKSWRAAKFFADGAAETTSDGAGWDRYPMADEYAPGKFFVVWEHDTSRIKVNKLDISDT
ncbi:sialidase family protein [Streptomyces sp. Qhu-G9]|uniref:sialidase family protein n=1 Tax=Streptomyces sp. Qhu-G9 TaxID=3452799 RepID=UPI0022AC6860|nr:sialidase family protein [Streptomyces aurantiacus]WAU79937.1 sialidase family protein [Streptomyces aurantiacus]